MSIGYIIGLIIDLWFIKRCFKITTFFLFLSHSFLQKIVASYKKIKLLLSHCLSLHPLRKHSVAYAAIQTLPFHAISPA